MLSSLLFAASLSADTYPRQPGVDAQHYVFRLTLLTSDSNEVQGDASCHGSRCPETMFVKCGWTSRQPERAGRE